MVMRQKVVSIFPGIVLALSIALMFVSVSAIPAWQLAYAELMPSKLAYVLEYSKGQSVKPYDDPTLPYKTLPDHDLNQSPCYHIVAKNQIKAHLIAVLPIV